MCTNTHSPDRSSRYLFALIAAGLLAPGVAACDRDRPAVEEEENLGAGKVAEPEGPTVEEVAEEPAPYYGDVVTLTGEVEEMFSERAFALEGNDWLFDEQLRVLTRTPVQLGGVALDEDDEVIVTGVVRRFVAAEIERELGWDVSPELEAELRENPVLIAQAIRRVEEAARWTEEEPQGRLVGLFAIVTAEPEVIIGQPVVIEAAPVRAPAGRGLWIGEERAQLFVVPAAGADVAGITAGERVDLNGVVRRMPPAADALRQWAVPQEFRAAIQEQPIYVEANRIAESQATEQPGAARGGRPEQGGRAQPAPATPGQQPSPQQRQQPRQQPGGG